MKREEVYRVMAWFCLALAVAAFVLWSFELVPFWAVPSPRIPIALGAVFLAVAAIFTTIGDEHTKKKLRDRIERQERTIESLQTGLTRHDRELSTLKTRVDETQKRTENLQRENRELRRQEEEKKRTADSRLPDDPEHRDS